MWAKDLIDASPKIHATDQQALDIFNTTNHQGNANNNTSHILGIQDSKGRLISESKDVNKVDPSYITNWRVKLYIIFENSLAIPQEVKYRVTRNSSLILFSEKYKNTHLRRHLYNNKSSVIHNGQKPID